MHPSKEKQKSPYASPCGLLHIELPPKTNTLCTIPFEMPDNSPEQIFRKDLEINEFLYLDEDWLPAAEGLVPGPDKSAVWTDQARNLKRDDAAPEPGTIMYIASSEDIDIDGVAQWAAIGNKIAKNEVKMKACGELTCIINWDDSAENP